jgi:hypothetical protein
MEEEARLQDGKAILPMKRVTLQVIKCLLHHKESRYQLAYIESDHLLIYTCLLCPKGEELARIKVAKEES